MSWILGIGLSTALVGILMELLHNNLMSFKMCIQIQKLSYSRQKSLLLGMGIGLHFVLICLYAYYAKTSDFDVSIGMRNVYKLYKKK